MNTDSAVRPPRSAAKCSIPAESRCGGDRPRVGVVENGDTARSAGEWLESSDTSRVIRRVARRYGLTGDDLPDLLQETRIALWKAGLETNVTAGWVFRIACHKAVDSVRSGIRRRARESRTCVISSAAQLPDAELEHLLHARVGELPARLRRFYELRYRQGLSQREVAQCLGVCRASVRWLDRCCLRCIGGRGRSGAEDRSQ